MRRTAFSRFRRLIRRRVRFSLRSDYRSDSASYFTCFTCDLLLDTQSPAAEIKNDHFRLVLYGIPRYTDPDQARTQKRPRPFPLGLGSPVNGPDIMLEATMNSGGTLEQPTFIAVAGQIGSGKTEVCRELQKRTGWELISAGGILRRMAIERGMSVLKLNEYAKMDPSVDREIDNYLASLAESPSSLIIDSRLAWHFVPQALKVYLIVDPSVAAERVFKAQRSDEIHPTLETACANNAERQRLERERFISLYSIDPENWRNYDLIVDSTTASPAEVAAVILERANGARNERLKPQCGLGPPTG
jgi:CMP/dCMP kinase